MSAAGWAHDDGKGFYIVLDTVPVGGFNGRFTLRATEPTNEIEAHQPAPDPMAELPKRRRDMKKGHDEKEGLTNEP